MGLAKFLYQPFPIVFEAPDKGLGRAGVVIICRAPGGQFQHQGNNIQALVRQGVDIPGATVRIWGFLYNAGRLQFQ